MKKNLIIALALVFVLGIAGTAFAAANPFVDVPAKHWAYDAVAKLAQAGILDGYGDGTYRGERLATRYELAQATAKAMARADKADAQMKAIIDKLAVEFAAELNNLGVRVAKLEKNASSIKFWGDARLRMVSGDQGRPTDATTLTGANATAVLPYYKDRTYWDQRLRVYAQADLNDKAQFFGRMMANWRDVSVANTSYESSIYWDYGYFQWTFDPGFKMAIGRQQIIAANNLFWTNGGYDAVQFMFGAPSDNFTAKIGYGDVGTYTSAGSPTVNNMTKPVWLLDMNYNLNKNWKVTGSMYYATNAGDAKITGQTQDANLTYAKGYPFQVYSLGFKGNLNQDFKLGGWYFWNASSVVADTYVNDKHDGWMLDLWYKGADKSKVGTWGLNASYREIKPFAIDLSNVAGPLGNSMIGAYSQILGQKGWGFAANYTISKNAVLTVNYEALSYNSSISTATLQPFYYVQMNVNF
ncbi:MAG: omp-alpha 5 [Firmicutes bacterium]|nr:omp-alpha 5 [Bacillota bacterium]